VPSSLVYAADLIVIPCRPQIYDLETVSTTKQLIALSGEKPSVVVLGAHKIVKQWYDEMFDEVGSGSFGPPY
jgi:cellulose biosynthesis protein BcsQ